jgi:lysine 2,3-aminomutase
VFDPAKYTPDYLRANVPQLFDLASRSKNMEAFRLQMNHWINLLQYETFGDYEAYSEGTIIRVRDCAQSLKLMFTRRSEDKAQFSVAQALFDLGQGRSRPDLAPAFIADIMHIFLGLQGKGQRTRFADYHLAALDFHGREAAVERSRQLDTLAEEIKMHMARYAHGLDEASVLRRRQRREHIQRLMGATSVEWMDWQWQYRHVLKDPERIAQLVHLTAQEMTAIQLARQARIPFGITPHYLSLMDADPNGGNDRAIRAQVIPPESYVHQMARHDPNYRSCLDFMREADTSPVDLITRRYPSICIFKPFNTCPQICVYCQRNWEIDDAMGEGALASGKQIRTALEWIERHPAIREVLITGGDPLGMADEDLESILAGVTAIPHVERIRIGTRTLVTAPMRITDRLAQILAKCRIPGRRQVCVVTHIQHPYEITPDTVAALERLKTRGIPTFNQLVYTFYISRRFEAALLRRSLARIGVEPYYTFNTKGKEETLEYRTPIARLLQEQKEEARMLPGLERTDEAVYNVPGMGKNYLRARQHHDLISILPDGARLIEFHPWEKNISKTMTTHIGQDVPILDYLARLKEIGEDTIDYETIWYYF